MIQSRRVRPTTALRRTQSSTSPTKPSFKSEGVDFARKYGFRQLLDSPLPSPALPSLTPRHGKTPPPHRVRHALRVLLRLGTWLCGVSLVYWIASTVLGSSELPAAVSYVSSNGRTYEFAADDSISFEATPVVVTDRRGKARWTVSIPPSLDFPLRPGDYANICQRAGKVSERLRGVKGGPASTEGSVVYDHNDPTFMDIQEAEQDGLLPAASENAAGPSRRPVALEVEKRFKDENQMSLQHESRNGICERSLTYVMETVDAGLGKTLMGLWMSYGLAKEEGRAFFIDDTNWAYGKYTTFFQSPPLPSCHPPPPSHRLPCPHQARHLVLSTSTVPWTFGRAFNAKYQDIRKPDPFRQQDIFSLLRAGHDALFHLAHSGADFVSSRISELDSYVHSEGGITVGLHIRHGDRHPWEFQYKESYIPPSNYLDAARAMISSHFRNTTTADNPSPSRAELASRILLASDDPDVYESADFPPTIINRAQSQILLASKTTLDASSPKPPPSEDGFTKFIDTNVGWEGGFFASVFWGLGNAAKSSSSLTVAEESQTRKQPSKETMALRELVARAYLLDLKILGGSDRVVCTVSSVGCRLLAVMMGWERAVVGQEWKNVDGSFGWVGFEE